MYQDDVYFSEVDGNGNGIRFKNIANFLLCNVWYNSRKDTIKDKTESIIQKAAKIILNGIPSTNYQYENYPPDEKIANIEKECQCRKSIHIC